MVAAVGLACGAGLPVLAVAATAGHFLVTRGYPRLIRVVAAHRREPPTLRLGYADGHGVLRTALTACVERGFAVRDIDVVREGVDDDGVPVAVVTLRLDGRGDVGDLAGEFAELPGVHDAATGPREHD